MKKEDILANLPPSIQQELKTLSDNQWKEYFELIKDYQSGGWAPDGWQFLIEMSMMRVGASERQAFLLAAHRHDL